MTKKRSPIFRREELSRALRFACITATLLVGLTAEAQNRPTWTGGDLPAEAKIETELAPKKKIPGPLMKDGSGVRNGYMVFINGKWELLDLKNPLKCQIVYGKDVLKAYPQISDVLKKLEDASWYLSFDLREEFLADQFCFTEANLIPGKASDAFYPMDTRNSPEIQNAKRAGLRIPMYPRLIFIDRKKIPFPAEASPTVSQFMFLIHEAAQIYFPGYHLLRDQFHADLVNEIALIYQGQETDLTRINEIFLSPERGAIFPTTSGALAPFRKQITYALSSTFDERKRLILEEENPESLIAIDSYRVNPALAYWHRLPQTLVPRLTDDVTQIVANGSIEDFRKILVKPWREIPMASIILAAIPSLDEEKRRVVSTTKFFRMESKSEIEWLSSLKPKFENERIMATPDLQTITSSKSGNNVPLISVVPRRRKRDQQPTPAQVKAIASSIIALANRNLWNEIEDFVKDPSFVSAFQLETAQTELEKLGRDHPNAVNMRSDVRLGRDILRLVARGIRERLVDEVNAKLDFESQEKFAKILPAGFAE